eukprot:535203_1
MHMNHTAVGPCKPPLPNPNNILSSIPNSSQLANIANAALQNIMSIPTTPPPPLPAGFEFQSNPNTKLPPGLPVPKHTHYNPSAATPDLPLSIHGAVQDSPDPAMAPAVPPSLPFNSSSKPRKRRKRANKKKNREREEDRTSEINETKRNLIHAIELERRNHELTKIRLVQLHKHYGNMLATLKQERGFLMNKLKVLNNGPSQNDLEVILKQKQGLRNEYLRKRAARFNDEQQLKQTNQENQKLVVVVHYLKQQLNGLLTQYQSLCAKQLQHQNDAEFSDAQKIVNNLDSLDIVDAESMVNQENRTMLQTAAGASTAMAHQINNDPWFHKITDENRMLERHIRFLRHIIERETQRCNFKELIVGKQLVSQESPEKKYE